MTTLFSFEFVILIYVSRFREKEDFLSSSSLSSDSPRILNQDKRNHYIYM